MKYRGLCKLCANEVDNEVDYDLDGKEEPEALSDEDWAAIQEDAFAEAPYDMDTELAKQEFGPDYDPYENDEDMRVMEESTFADISRLQENVPNEDGPCGDEADDMYSPYYQGDPLDVFGEPDYADYGEDAEYLDDDYEDDIDIDGDIDYAVDDIAENAYDDDFDFMGESKNDMFKEISKNAKVMRESRALPGGNLDSKEKTEYENWLEKLHKNLDKNKSKEDENWAPKLFNSDCADNGYHDWDGNPLKKPTDFAKNENKKK